MSACSKRISMASQTYEKASVIRGHHVYKAVWAPFIGEELPLKAEVFRHTLIVRTLSTCGSWPRSHHYTTRRLFKTRRLLPFFGSSPRRLNEAGVYLMPAFIRRNTVHVNFSTCTALCIQTSNFIYVHDGS